MAVRVLKHAGVQDRITMNVTPFPMQSIHWLQQSKMLDTASNGQTGKCRNLLLCTEKYEEICKSYLDRRRYLSICPGYETEN